MKLNTLYILFLIFAVVGCKSPEARRPVSQNSGSFINESIERNRELVAKEEAVILKMIEQDSTKNYITSSNGFWYYYNVRSSDSLNVKMPEYGDVVRFDYNIRSLQGDYIYAENEIPTKRYAMDREDLFGGLREGIKLMKAGETVTFIFPSHKAFGYYGDKNKIGTNIPIITEVKLHTITQELNTNKSEN